MEAGAGGVATPVGEGGSEDPAPLPASCAPSPRIAAALVEALDFDFDF